MKSKIIISAIMAMSLAAGGSAFAKDNDHRDGDRHGYSQRNDHRGDRDHRDDDRNGRSHRGGQGWDRGHDRAYNNDRGAGPRHDFRRGGRISNEYRSRQYVVNDWRGHRLHAPPRGYQWVQTGPDYVLIAVATGIIAQIVLSN